MHRRAFSIAWTIFRYTKRPFRKTEKCWQSFGPASTVLEILRPELYLRVSSVSIFDTYFIFVLVVSFLRHIHRIHWRIAGIIMVPNQTMCWVMETNAPGTASEMSYSLRADEYERNGIVKTQCINICEPAQTHVGAVVLIGCYINTHRTWSYDRMDLIWGDDKHDFVNCGVRIGDIFDFWRAILIRLRGHCQRKVWAAHIQTHAHSVVIWCRKICCHLFPSTKYRDDSFLFSFISSALAFDSVRSHAATSTPNCNSRVADQ